MAFEREAMDFVKFDVAMEHGQRIKPWFKYGTMWCDHINEEEADTIVSSLETFTGYKVKKSLLRRSKTEPWNQWAFDITNFNLLA